jgi:alkylated DNA repair dioxygenase AlkB
LAGRPVELSLRERRSFAQRFSIALGARRIVTVEIACPVNVRIRPLRRVRELNVAQLTLFESTDRILANDERGRITYEPRFVDAITAAAWFAELRAGVSWRGMRRAMYDRDVDVPRLIGHYRLDPSSGDTPPAILAAAARVTTHLNVPFNSVGLNLYRDGRDSVAPHNDHLYELREGFPIALVSLGATRRMTIRAKTAPPRTTHIDLEPGSLFVMDYATQLHYTHGVPKSHEPVGERISLAFRVKPDRDTPNKGGRSSYQ